jgi:hypothetical protein
MYGRWRNGRKEEGGMEERRREEWKKGGGRNGRKEEGGMEERRREERVEKLFFENTACFKFLT